MWHSTELKETVVRMNNSGLPPSQIAKHCDLPVNSVKSILRRFKKRGTVESLKPSGRPKKLSDRDVRSLVSDVKTERRATLQDITNNMVTKVSTSTVRRALGNEGIHSRVARKKPYLSDKHMVDRFAFAKKYVGYAPDFWKRVIWCDKSSFEIGKNSRLIRVWRRPHEEFEPDCLAPTFRSGRVSLMIWAAISWEMKSELAFMESGKRTATDYVEVVYNGPLRKMMEQISDAILMEDGAPIHRSKAPKEWREQHGLEKLDWPAQSPDLNPIENIWMQMKDHVQKRQPSVKSTTDMKEALREAWNAVDFQSINKLIASVPDRLAAVIKAKGGSTRF